MKRNGKLLSLILLTLTPLLLISCSVSPTKQATLQETKLSNLPHIHNLINQPPQITLTSHHNSEFLQVNASFYIAKNKVDVFRTISDLAVSSQWFDRLKSIETLAFINNNNFILRSIITSPWPFKNRELITCVNTDFLDNSTIIIITSCSDKYPQHTSALVRVEHAESRWTITSINHQQLTPQNVLTKVDYQAWLNPNGYVPAFFFNHSLKSSTKKSLDALKSLIETTF